MTVLKTCIHIYKMKMRLHLFLFNSGIFRKIYVKNHDLSLGLHLTGKIFIEIPFIIKKNGDMFNTYAKKLDVM